MLLQLAAATVPQRARQNPPKKRNTDQKRPTATKYARPEVNQSTWRKREREREREKERGRPLATKHAWPEELVHPLTPAGI
jgi:hypothetical protein